MKIIHDWFIVVDDQEYKFFHTPDVIDEWHMMRIIEAACIEDGTLAVLRLPFPTPFETKLFRNEQYSLVPYAAITELRVRERPAEAERLVLADYIRSTCSEN